LKPIKCTISQTPVLVPPVVSAKDTGAFTSAHSINVSHVTPTYTIPTYILDTIFNDASGPLHSEKKILDLFTSPTHTLVQVMRF